MHSSLLPVSSLSRSFERRNGRRCKRPKEEVITTFTADFMAHERVTDGEYGVIGFLGSRKDFSFTGRKQGTGKKLSSGHRLSLFFSPLRGLRAVSPAVNPLSGKLHGKHNARCCRPPRCRCIAGNGDRSGSNKTNWFIAFSVQSRRGGHV